MDDILLAAENYLLLHKALTAITAAIQTASLTINEKIQKMPPWRYLGLQILSQTIQPQPLQLKDNPQMLHDLQKLLGSISRVRPLLGITNEDLAPLFVLLRGDSTLNSPRQQTTEAKEESVCSHSRPPNLQNGSSVTLFVGSFGKGTPTLCFDFPVGF